MGRYFHYWKRKCDFWRSWTRPQDIWQWQFLCNQPCLPWKIYAKSVKALALFSNQNIMNSFILSALEYAEESDWVNVWLDSYNLCHQEVNTLLSPLHVSNHTCPRGFFASEICGGCWQWSGLCAVVLFRGVSCFSCFPVTCSRMAVLLPESQVASGSKDCPGPPWPCPAMLIPCDLDEW